MNNFGSSNKSIEDVEKGMLKYLSKKYDDTFYIDEIGTTSVSSTAILALARSQTYPNERVRVHYFKDSKIPYQDNYAGVLLSQQIVELIRPGIEEQFPNVYIDVSFQIAAISPKLGKDITYEKFIKEEGLIPITIGIYTPYYPDDKERTNKVLALSEFLLEVGRYSWVHINFLENEDMEWIYNTPLPEIRESGNARIRHYSSFYVRYKKLDDGTRTMHIDALELNGTAIQFWEDTTKSPIKSKEDEQK